MKQALIGLGVLLCLLTSVNAQLTVGLTKAVKNESPGYTLLAPNNSTSTYLIDYCGRAVHTWVSTHAVGFRALLMANGDLIRMQRLNTSPILQGAGGGIEKRAWDGRLLWNYVMSDSTRVMHHDFTVLPNGNILVLVAERYSKQEAWARGRDTAYLADDFWIDAVYELSAIGSDDAEIVWKWTLWDHLVQELDPSKEGYGKISEHPERVDINFTHAIQGKDYSDFSHGNSIDYNPTTDQILISARNFNEVWIVDHSTTTAEASTNVGGKRNNGGRILYRWGNPRAYGVGSATDQKLFGQHNAHWIQEGLPHAGSIMIFNNGLNRPGGQYASVDIIDAADEGTGNYPPPIDGFYEPKDLEFTYVGDTIGSLQSVFMSGAQFTTSGNLRVTQAMRGIITETDPNLGTVWQYVCPINIDGAIQQGDNPSSNGVFNTQWYSVSYPAFVGRGLSLGVPLEINPIDIGCSITTVQEEPSMLDQSAQLSFAPNPCELGGTIAIPESVKSITISSIWGQVLQTITVSGGEQFISLSELPSGCYAFRADNGEVILVTKM